MTKYKVTINWHGEVLTFYTFAKNEKKALINAMVRLAGSLNCHVRLVKYYVEDVNANRWKVEVE
jgi:hypothetical protein